MSNRACGIADRTKSERDLRSTTSDQNADLCAHVHHGPEGTTIETPLNSVLSSPPKLSPPNFRSTQGGVKNSKGSLPSYLDCSEDEKEMIGGRDLLDCTDTSIFILELDGVQENHNIEGLLMLRSLLASMKQELMVHIMDEFMDYLKQNLGWGTRTHGNAPDEAPNSTYQSEPRTASQFSSNNRRRQYNGDENNKKGPGDGDDDDDDEDERAPKRVRASSVTTDNNPKFTCPYRKYDPRKYCVQNWRPCALTPLENVARVKFVTCSLQKQLHY